MKAAPFLDPGGTARLVIPDVEPLAVRFVHPIDRAPQQKALASDEGDLDRVGAGELAPGGVPHSEADLEPARGDVPAVLGLGSKEGSAGVQDPFALRLEGDLARGRDALAPQLDLGRRVGEDAFEVPVGIGPFAPLGQPFEEGAEDLVE